jgi:hypothetical protein
VFYWSRAYQSESDEIRLSPSQQRDGGDIMSFKKIVFKKVLKSFRRVLKSKNSLKS